MDGDSRGLGGLDAQAVALVSAALSRRRVGAAPPPPPTLAHRGTEEGEEGGVGLGLRVLQDASELVVIARSIFRLPPHHVSCRQTPLPHLLKHAVPLV
jgi:hypothetical protein